MILDFKESTFPRKINCENWFPQRERFWISRERNLRFPSKEGDFDFRGKELTNFTQMIFLGKENLEIVSNRAVLVSSEREEFSFQGAGFGFKEMQKT